MTNRSNTPDPAPLSLLALGAAGRMLLALPFIALLWVGVAWVVR